MAVHIGSIIKDLVKTKRIKIDDFADSINCTRRNVYKIFDKPSIDTNLLATINKSLGQNLFFNYLKDEEIAEYRNSKVKSTELLFNELSKINKNNLSPVQFADLQKTVNNL